ncbi:MAG: hypothetical protein HYU35_01335 [Parcubacteria group bacterium]|nr:hypothetical protein [Parcubacteria group bacterium]
MKNLAAGKKKLWRRHVMFAGMGVAAMAATALLRPSVVVGPVVYSVEPSSEAAATKAAEEQKPAHIATPAIVRAVYMTSWVAGTPKWREQIVGMITRGELNTLVIDIKDYSGHISFAVNDPKLMEVGAVEERIPDAREFIDMLHEKGIYIIGRVSVFQDPYLVGRRPDLAVKRKSDGAVWKDYKGISWLDPASREVWDYHVRIAREAERVGFDEINFDYIRFPSDGNMRDIAYDWWDGVRPKALVLKDFFAYLDSELSDLGVPISADLFGMTTWNYDDLNIGQILEYAAPHFDFIAPMVYPSHYPKTFMGFANPAAHPYEIIFSGMERARDRLRRSMMRDWNHGCYGMRETLIPLLRWMRNFCRAQRQRCL